MLPPNINGNVRRIEPYHRNGRIQPVMRVGAGQRSPLLFRRSDVEKLRDELIAEIKAQLVPPKRGDRKLKQLASKSS
jgi:hypothetical protein